MGGTFVLVLATKPQPERGKVEAGKCASRLHTLSFMAKQRQEQGTGGGEASDSDEEGIEFVAAGSDPNFSVEDLVFEHNPDFEDFT